MRRQLPKKDSARQKILQSGEIRQPTLQHGVSAERIDLQRNQVPKKNRRLKRRSLNQI